VTATAINPYRVWIRVKPTDFAYFIHVPGPDSLKERTHSRVHRANVDERDPLHRPLPVDPSPERSGLPRRGR
jgi:hypothetical protein